LTTVGSIGEFVTVSGRFLSIQRPLLSTVTVNCGRRD